MFSCNEHNIWLLIENNVQMYIVGTWNYDMRLIDHKFLDICNFWILGICFAKAHNVLLEITSPHHSALTRSQHYNHNKGLISYPLSP